MSEGGDRKGEEEEGRRRGRRRGGGGVRVVEVTVKIQSVECLKAELNGNGIFSAAKLMLYVHIFTGKLRAPKL